MDQKRTFAVVLEPEEEGGFTVRVPALPEIVTFGRDEREALVMAEDAIRLVLEDCAARGEPIRSTHSPGDRYAGRMNQRLPALRSREVIRALERAGFVVSRTSGSHCRLIHSADPTRKVTMPVHSDDLRRGTRSFIAQAGLTVGEFIELL